METYTFVERILRNSIGNFIQNYCKCVGKAEQKVVVTSTKSNGNLMGLLQVPFIMNSPPGKYEQNAEDENLYAVQDKVEENSCDGCSNLEPLNLGWW